MQEAILLIAFLFFILVLFSLGVSIYVLIQLDKKEKKPSAKRRIGFDLD